MKRLALIAFAAGACGSTESVATPAPPAKSVPPPKTFSATCGAPSATQPPSKIEQLSAGAGVTCARLANGSVWCWGERGQTMIRSDATAPVACPVATRVEPFGVVDDIWSSYRTTCVAARGSARCAVIADWGFAPDSSALDARVAFQWNGLPCAITRDAKLRCYEGQRTSDTASFRPADQIAVTRDGRELCVLSKTAVGCLREGKVEVLASNVSQITAANNLWALRRDGTVVRLDTCNEGGTWKPCSVPVAGMRDAISIASGGATACVVQRDGRVVCVDCIAKTGCTDAAKPVDGITDATQVAVGNGHACALRKTGEVVCWGASDCGQAGGTVEAGKVCTPNTVVPPTTITWAK